MDWTLLAILVLSIVVGAARGFVFEILSLAGWFVAWFAARAGAPFIAPQLPVGTPGSLANNEEIYYFRVGKLGSLETSAEGLAFHHTYTADRSIDETVIVRDGDAFLVPRGYHGPCVAAPGYPLYYLNVMAGPNPERTMAIVDDPPYAWIRSSWDAMPVDPRCPMTTPSGAR